MSSLKAICSISFISMLVFAIMTPVTTPPTTQDKAAEAVEKLVDVEG